MTRHTPAAGRLAEPPPLPARHRGFDVISRSLAREALLRQGVYETGGQPTVYDPVFTQQGVPEAVLRHEEVHQSLALQTFHGVLTLILSRYARVADAGASLAACEATQWYVQETGGVMESPLGFGGTGYAPVAADYDGDGKADHAVFHAAKGLWFIRQSLTSSVATPGFGGPT